MMPLVLATVHGMAIGSARLALVAVQRVWPVAVDVAAGAGVAGWIAAAFAVIAGLAGRQGAAADRQQQGGYQDGRDVSGHYFSWFGFVSVTRPG
jgi:hypothetical protein